MLSGTLDNLARYETTLERGLASSIEQLEARQEKRWQKQKGGALSAMMQGILNEKRDEK